VLEAARDAMQASAAAVAKRKMTKRYTEPPNYKRGGFCNTI